MAIVTKQSAEDRYLCMPEIAHFLQVSEKWLYRNREILGIPFCKFGKHLRVLKSDLEKWAADQK